MKPLILWTLLASLACGGEPPADELTLPYTAVPVGGGAPANAPTPPAPLKAQAPLYEDGHYLYLGAVKPGLRALLVLLPGAMIPAADYVALAREIQRQSSLGLSVGIAKLTLDMPNPVDAEVRLHEIRRRARRGGPIDDRQIFLAGHSLGGIVARDLVRLHGLGGLILLGAYLPRLPLSPGIEDYGRPVLTLGGELDGQTWITRIAREVGLQQQYAASAGESQAAADRPVVLVEQVNHRQLAGGTGSDEDLPPEISLARAHQRVAAVVADFLQAQRLPPAPGAVGRLLKEVKRTRALVSGYLLARDQEDGPWCEQVQRWLANLAAPDNARLATDHVAYDDLLGFMWSKPQASVSGGGVSVTTRAHASWFTDPMDSSPDTPESARELSCKMKSQQALLGLLPGAASVGPRTCADLNALTLDWALQRVSPAAKARFAASGAQLTFAPDKGCATGIGWVSSGLELTPTAPGQVAVRSPALVTAPGAGSQDGVCYCKLLSPARAVEWVLVEGLKR